MRLQYRLIFNWMLPLTLCAAIPAGIYLHAGTVSCRVLQQQMDRLYFPRGEESLVLPGAGFQLFCGVDTVGTGLIEWSRPGIAVSQPMLVDTAVSSCGTLMALITIPDVDSTSEITLRVDSRLPWQFALSRSDSAVKETETDWRTAIGNPVHIIESDRAASGITTDAELSFADDRSGGERRDIETTAPYIAALVPNPGRSVNRQGFLTTSAYYRFGDMHLPYLLPGSKTSRQDRFDRADSGDVRLYPYAPERGRGLIGNMADRPTSIRLSYLHPGLKAAAQFFADVFARDRIRVEVVAMDSTADLMVAWLPFRATDPVAGPEVLYELLTRSDAADPAQREALSLIKQYLELAKSSSTVSARVYYMNLVDRSFKEDLGAFPLFRPVERIIPQDRLRNIRTDVNGRLMTSEFILLTYPSESAAGESK